MFAFYAASLVPARVDTRGVAVQRGETSLQRRGRSPRESFMIKELITAGIRQFH